MSRFHGGWGEYKGWGKENAMAKMAGKRGQAGTTAGAARDVGTLGTLGATLIVARAPLGKANDHPNSATDTRHWPAASTNPNFKFFENDASMEMVRRALSDTYCSLTTHYWSTLLGQHLSLAYTRQRYSGSFCQSQEEKE